MDVDLNQARDHLVSTKHRGAVHQYGSTLFCEENVQNFFVNVLGREPVRFSKKLTPVQAFMNYILEMGGDVEWTMTKCAPPPPPPPPLSSRKAQACKAVIKDIVSPCYATNRHGWAKMLCCWESPYLMGPKKRYLEIG